MFRPARALAAVSIALLTAHTCTDVLWEEYLEKRGLTLPDVDTLP